MTDLDPRTTPSAAQLDLLERIGAAFQKVESQPVPPECLFEWRHLRVTEKIGEGGFGEVYRAYDPQLRRDVALKLSRADSGDRLTRDAVMAEARRMARLRHPHILAVHGADEADGRVGIWFDLLGGQTLEALCEASGPLPSEGVVRLTAPIADALVLIHARGMVHGDIKPANIMVLEDGLPVLMDFGAARDSLSLQPQTAGSPLLMAPEQFDGAAPSPASDLYALGATLYRTLSGRFPRSAPSYEALAALHQAAPAIDFSAVPRAWRPLLTQLLSRDPDRRGTAVELKRNIELMATSRQRRIRRVAVSLVIGSLMAATMAAFMASRTQALSRQQTESTKGVLIEAVQSVSPLSSSSPGTIQTLYQNLLELSESLLDHYPQGQGDLMLVAAQGLAGFGDHERAIRGAEQGVALLAADPDTTVHSLATAYNILGTVYNAAERYEDSARVARQVLELLEGQDYERAEELRLVAHNKIYFALDGLGRWREALAAQRDLLVARQNHFGADSLRLAVDHHNLAATLMQFGEFAEAVSHSRQAVGILEHNGEGNSSRMGIALSGLGRGLVGTGDVAAAVEAEQRARSLLTQSLGADHWRIRGLDLLAARIHLASGQTEAGVEILSQLRELESLSERDLFEVRKLLATVAMEQQQWAAATRAWDQAIEGMPDSARLLRPVITAARAVSAYRAGQLEQPPTAILQTTLAELQRQGLEQVWGAEQLRQWLSELAG